MPAFTKNRTAELCPYWCALKRNLMRIGMMIVTYRHCDCTSEEICYNCLYTVSSVLNTGTRSRKRIFFTNFVQMLNTAIEHNVNTYHKKYIKMKEVRNRVGRRVIVIYLSDYDNGYKGTDDTARNIAWYVL